MSAALANLCVGLYARFSTTHQRDASIEDQLRRCAAYVRSLGGQVNDEMIFSDAAISGSSLARPAFERMMSLIKRGVINVVVTEDVSRISRDFADSASVLRELEWAGCRLIGIADGIDTAAGGSKLLFGIKSTDLVTYAAAVGLILAAAALASYLPARRASAIDPMQTLKAE